MSPKVKNQSASGNLPQLDAPRPLAALLSQVLVAFTIELDNEFERRMAESGVPGARLSLMVWCNLMRFVPERGVPVRDLTALVLCKPERILFMIGCLERWGFVELIPPAANAASPRLRPHSRYGRMLRDGWGTGRGIRSDWLVRPTRIGLRAQEIWPPLVTEIEQRWETRFGENAMQQLRGPLETIIENLEVELPDALPDGFTPEETEAFPPRKPDAIHRLSLAALLS
ncbi:MAG: hypothetical protein ACRD5L_14850, partial [Bryobacteraceae bacterium]